MSLKDFRAQGMAIEGMEELMDTLDDVLPREAKNLARTTVQNIAQQLVKLMRFHAPKDTGTLRKAIVAVRRRGTATQVASDVLITKGRGQKNDAWYWHFVEWSTTQKPATPFIQPSIETITPSISDIFREQWGKNLEKLLARKAAKAAKI